jgi:hypothetical protein
MGQIPATRIVEVAVERHGRYFPQGRLLSHIYLFPANA